MKASQTYQEEALEVALVGEDILKDNPIVVSRVRLLLRAELGLYLLVFGLDIRVIRRELPQLGEVLQPLLGLAMVDQEARSFGDQRNHDAHQATGDELNAW